MNDCALLDAGRVSVDLFRNTDAREVFRTMAGLREVGRPVNRETLLEIGERVPFSYLADLSEMATGANAEFYLDHLVEDAQKREIQRVALWLTEAAENGEAPGTSWNPLRRTCRVRCSVVDTGDVDVRATMHELITTVEQRIRDKANGPSGIPTGLRELDTSRRASTWLRLHPGGAYERRKDGACSDDGRPPGTRGDPDRIRHAGNVSASTRREACLDAF